VYILSSEYIILMIDIPITESYAVSRFSSLVQPVEKFVREMNQESEYELSPSRYSVIFSEKPVSYCIGIIDMVDSTKLAASLGMSKMSRYYQNFLNLMSKIIEVYNGRVVKNVGDCLLFYFPETFTTDDKSTITKCIECSLAMIDSHEFLCRYMKKDGLPCINYRISMDFGGVILMKLTGSKSLDMIGPAINMCCKINRCAEKNGVVIGGDLYRIAKHVDKFVFKEIKGCSAGFKLEYPVYTVKKTQ